MPAPRACYSQAADLSGLPSRGAQLATRAELPARPPPSGRPAPPRRGPKGPLEIISGLPRGISSLGLDLGLAVQAACGPGARPMRPRWGIARPCAHPCPRSAGEPLAAPFARRLAGRLRHLSRSAGPPLPRASPVVIHTRSHHCRRPRRRRRGGRPASSAPLLLWIRWGASPRGHHPGIRRAPLGRRCRVTRSFLPHRFAPSALRAVLRRACRRAGWPLPSCFVRRIVAACTSAGPGTAPPAVLSGAAPRTPRSAAR